MELFVSRIHLHGELIALGAERDVFECAIQLVDLSSHKEQVFAELEHDVLCQLLKGLRLGLGNPLTVGRQAALLPALQLSCELVEPGAISVCNESTTLH